MPIKSLRDANHDLRQMHHALLDLVIEKDATIDRKEHQIIHLHAQVRALMAGITIQQEPTKMGRVNVEPDYEAIEADLRSVEDRTA